MQNRQVDTKTTFQARLDIGWRKVLLSMRARSGKTIRKLIEDALSEVYAIDEGGEPYDIRR